MFSAQSVQSSKDAIINDLNNIAANAYQFRIRPVSMGGGGGVYDKSKGATAAYDVPSKMKTNANGTYSVVTGGADKITLQGTNPQYTAGTVTVDLGSTGDLTNWVYGADYQ